jgi:hypothetical protein
MTERGKKAAELISQLKDLMWEEFNSLYSGLGSADDKVKMHKDLCEILSLLMLNSHMNVATRIWIQKQKTGGSNG